MLLLKLTWMAMVAAVLVNTGSTDLSLVYIVCNVAWDVTHGRKIKSLWVDFVIGLSFLAGSVLLMFQV